MSDSRARGHAWTAIAVASVVLLGAGLRCLALGEESAWGDEALTTVCFPVESFSGYLQCVFSEDSRLRMAPLYYWLQYGWSLIGGGDLVGLRVFSVFLTALASVQLFLLVTSLANRTAGLWAMLFFNLSLFETYYGQEVRFYALMNVFALAAIHGALWYSRGRTRAGLALAFVGNAGLVWTHTFAVVFVLGLGLYMLRYWRQPRILLPWFGAHGAMALGLFGWLALLRYDFGGQSEAYNDMPAGWRELANTLVQFCGGRFSNMNPSEYLPWGLSAEPVIVVLLLALVAFVVIRAFLSWRRGETGALNPGEIALLLVCLIAPVILLYSLGRLWRPVFYTRYVIYSALPLYALAGMGLSVVPWRSLRSCVGMALLLLFAWQNFALPRPLRADYQAVARVVDADPAPDRVVLALKPFNYDAVAYAIRETGVPAELLYGLKETAGVSIDRASEGVSVWVVFYRWNDFAGFETRIAEAGLTARRLDTAGMPPLTVYHVAPPGGWVTSGRVVPQ